MATSVGRVPATVKIDDYFVTFFNKTLEAGDSMREIRFYDDACVGPGGNSGTRSGLPRYCLNVDIGDQTARNRCLHFVRHNQQGADEADFVNPIPAIYIPDVTITAAGGGISAVPIFEVISPTITNVGGKSFQLTWWTNTDEMEQWSGGMDYNPQLIKKFSANDLDDFEDNANGARLLCTASIVWENLKLSKGSNPDASGGAAPEVEYLPTPVIYHVGVVHMVHGEGYIVDFSTGGGGGGMKVHSHTSIEDGGFAVSVYAPSAMIRPANWF